MKRLNLKELKQQLIVCLDMKCVFTQVSTYSGIHCMPGWATYINCGKYCA